MHTDLEFESPATVMYERKQEDWRHWASNTESAVGNMTANRGSFRSGRGIVTVLFNSKDGVQMACSAHTEY